MTRFRVLGLRTQHILFAVLILSFSGVASAPLFATTISYDLDFSKSFGRTVTDGSFQFNSLGQTKTAIADADFVDLEAFVGSVLFTASSPVDDFARVNKNGVVKGLFADLEGPGGDILQLYAGPRHRYVIWDSDMDSVLGRGTYDVAPVKTAVPEPSSLSLLTLSLGLLLGAAFMMRNRRNMNSVPSLG